MSGQTGAGTTSQARVGRTRSAPRKERSPTAGRLGALTPPSGGCQVGYSTFRGRSVTVCNKRWGRFRTAAECRARTREDPICLNARHERSICLLSTSTRECMVSIRGISDDPNGSLVHTCNRLPPPGRRGRRFLLRIFISIVTAVYCVMFGFPATRAPNSQSNHTIGRITRLGRRGAGSPVVVTAEVYRSLYLFTWVHDDRERCARREREAFEVWLLDVSQTKAARAAIQTRRGVDASDRQSQMERDFQARNRLHHVKECSLGSYLCPHHHRRLHSFKAVSHARATAVRSRQDGALRSVPR